MLPFNLLRAAFLASMLIPWAHLVTTAIPIPANHHTTYVSNHHPDHYNRAQAGHDRTNRAGDIHIFDVEHSNGHMTGSIVVDPRRIRSMTLADLHAHAERVDEHLRTHYPGANYHVQLHHKPGDGHAKIHAVPSHHMSQTGTDAMRLAGPVRPNVPTHPDDKKAIYDALRSMHRPPHGVARDPRFQLRRYPASNHMVHGSIFGGTVPIAFEEYRHGMDAGALHAHADFAHDHVIPNEHLDKMHIHAHHEIGEDVVELHMMPARKGVTPNEIKSFLKKSDRTNTELHKASITQRRPGDPPVDGENQLTFRGVMDSHTRGRMIPEQLNAYAEYAKDEVASHHRLDGDDKYGMSMSTAHKHRHGENRPVYFHTQPKTRDGLTRAHNEGYPQVSAAMERSGQTIRFGNRPRIGHRHSDTAALEFSAQSEGVRRRDFMDHAHGYVLGNAGRGNQPCDTCHETFKELNAGVTYTNMHRDQQNS